MGSNLCSDFERERGDHSGWVKGPQHAKEREKEGVREREAVRLWVLIYVAYVVSVERQQDLFLADNHTHIYGW